MRDTHAETIELRRKLENYQKDKHATQKLQKRHDALRKQLDNLKMELDAKVLHCDKITEERDELRQKFEEAVLDVQQKSSEWSRMLGALKNTTNDIFSLGLRSALLERKLSFLEKETEQRESLLGEVLKISNIEPTAMSTRIEKLLAQKNEKIGDLRYELARLSKAHDDMLEVFKAKMIKYGIPIEEFGAALPQLQSKKVSTTTSRLKR